MAEEKKSKKKTSKKEDYKVKYEELNNDYLRLRADFENFRKRKEQEIIETREKAKIDLVLELIPSIDNFEMSLKMTDNTEMFVKGVEMIHKNLIDTLKENHIEIYEPGIGEVFDPNLHEALVKEGEEVSEKAKIESIVKKGFKHKDKIIRAPKVQLK